MIRTAQPLSPQHTGGSIPSTISFSTNATRVSSMTSFAPSAGFDESRGRPSWRSGKDRMSPRESRVERPAVTAKSSSGNSVSLSELSKQPSNPSLIGSPTSAYSNFDILSPPTLVPKDQKSSSFSSTKVKIRPLLRKISSQEQNTVDLSRSVAENEGLGIFTNSSNSGATNRRAYHTRTSSGISQVSTTTTSSGQRGAQYVHPMRQTPQSYTPPLVTSRSRAGSTDDHFPYSQQGSAPAQSYAPLPQTPRRTPPPPLHIRTYSNNTSRANSTTNLHNPPTPSTLRQQTHTEPFPNHNPSPDTATAPSNMPLTARSSIDSAFRPKRSRTNTATTPTSDDPYAQVQALRQEFYAREAAKEAKYAAQEQRRQEKREASRRRRDEAAERKRARSRANSEKTAHSVTTTTDQISAIGYESTTPQPGPALVDEELEWIRRGKKPPQQREREERMRRAQQQQQQQGGNGAGANSVGKKAKAVSNWWGVFLFRVKTEWLKVKRGMGCFS